MELPTRNVAGSPISVSNPAELLMMAVTTIGPTKSTSSSFVMRMMTGASRITVVAFGRNAQSTDTSATTPSRKRLPLPFVADRNRMPICSKMPVGSRVRATTIPPKSRDSGPPADWTAFRMSCRVKIPKMINVLTPSMAATAMSITLMAIARMTPAKTARMMMDWSSNVMVPCSGFNGSAVQGVQLMFMLFFNRER